MVTRGHTASKCTDKSPGKSLLNCPCVYEHPDGITVQRINESLLLWGLVLSLELFEMVLQSFLRWCVLLLWPSIRENRYALPLVVCPGGGSIDAHFHPTTCIIWSCTLILASITSFLLYVLSSSWSLILIMLLTKSCL